VLLLYRAVRQRCPACPLQALQCCHRLAQVVGLLLQLILSCTASRTLIWVRVARRQLHLCQQEHARKAQQQPEAVMCELSVCCHVVATVVLEMVKPL
jgi:hypothetical protein